MKIDMAKTELRKQLINSRKLISIQEKDKLDNKIFQNLKLSYELNTCRKVLIYHSTDIEVGTSRIINYCRKNDKIVYLPRCQKNGHMNFYYTDENTMLQRSKYGIMEPFFEPDKIIKNFDDTVCIVPGLAFDREGYRIGYGGGYYDRFLSLHKNLVTIGICYSKNIVNKVIRNKFDLPVKFIADENILEECNGQ